MNIKETLLTLSNACGIGEITRAGVLTENLLKKYADNVTRNGLTVTGTLKGESDYTILLDAHIDEVGMVVTDISTDGFLTVSKCGGIDLRHLPAKPVTVHGKREIPAVFVSTPPHLSKADEVPTDITDCKIDTGLGSAAKDVISVGDFVTWRTSADVLHGDTVCGKSLDNRAGVACLLELAARLKGKKLPCNVIFLFSDAEELGLRGARTAAFNTEADEAVIIDVSFGSMPDIADTECGKLGGGGMIGISPVLDNSVTKAIINIAEQSGMSYQREVMGGTTSTNADVIALTKGGIKSGLISIPLRNMHTDIETVKISDIVSVCDMLEKYILSGGAMNA